MRKRKTIRGAAAALAAALSAATAAQAADIALKDPWARIHPTRVGEVVAYFTLENRGGMAMLVGADSGFAAVTAIRSDTDGRPGGATRVVDRMMIVGGAELAFKPGEYMVVLSRPHRPPREGDRFTLSLSFADGTKVETEVTISADGA